MLTAGSSLDLRGARSRSLQARRTGVSAPATVPLPSPAPSVDPELWFTKVTPKYTEGANDKDEFYEWANAAEETLRNILAVTTKVTHTIHSSKNTCCARAVGMLAVIQPTLLAQQVRSSE